jgi:ATP-dependent helicase/DNAse subunit B
VEGLAQWYETLDDLAEAQPDAPTEPEESEGSSPALPVGAQAARLRDSLAEFAIRMAPPLDRLSIPEWVTWLEELLDDLGFMQNHELERDQAALFSLQETLRALGMSSVIAGSRSLEYGSFVAELQGAFQGARYGNSPEQVRPTRPEVVVLRMLEARGVRFQAVAILGLSEGIYPQIERVDPFFSEADRRRFGLESRLDRQQAGVFYQALTRTDRFLLLTRPYLAEDGESWEPSPYWNEVRKLLPDSAFQMIRPDDRRPLEEAASTQELLFWAVQDAVRFEQDLPARYQALQKRWQQLGHARKVLQARLDRTAEGPYEGMPRELRGELGALFGSQHIWSASRLETYGSCPYRFYIEVVLGLQASQPPQPGLDASQLGSLLHAILEQAYRQAADPADPASVLAGLAKVASTAFQDAPQTYGFRPSILWDVQQEQWLANLENTILQNAAYDPAWTPVEYEARFGLGNQPALEIQSATGTIRLRGVIDRIDRNFDGNLRVVDYKTGGSHLAPSDLIDGLRLQLPIYALAVEQALNLGQVSEGLYWKILKAEPGSLKLASFEFEDAYAGVEGACELVEEHVGRFVEGIRQAEYPPVAPKGGCPSYCAAAAWCWRYSPASY